MNAIQEWNLIEQMMVCDFNPNHDPKDGRFSNGSISKANYKYLRSEYTSVIGGWGMAKNSRDYLSKNGISEEAIKELDQLIYYHGQGGSMQEAGDSELLRHLESMDEIGKAITLRSKFEMQVYSVWKNAHMDSDSLRNGELKIYRKGNRKPGVEAWTISEDGADFGHGGIGYNYSSTLEQMLREGYIPIAGFATMAGGPGEGEITFIKKE